MSMFRYSIASCRQSVVLRCQKSGLRNTGLIFARFYSDDKFKSIDEFQKRRKEYQFGKSDIEPVDKTASKDHINYEINTKDIHEGLARGRHASPNDAYFDSLIMEDPRLLDLQPGSPEYRHQMHLIHEEIKQKQREENASLELRERLKAIGIGLALIFGIIGSHYVYMNYEKLKNKVLFWTYKVDDSNVKDLNDPSKNTRNIDYLTNKLADELVDVTKHIQKSDEVTGLYLFGKINDKKLPTRFKFFDDMLIEDVQISNDYLVVVNKNGKLFQYYKGLKEPVKSEINEKIQECRISDDLVYALTKKGDVIYFPRIDKNVTSFAPLSKRSWIGLSRTQSYNKLDFVDDVGSRMLNSKERIAVMSLGKNHILMLSSQGRLFISRTYISGDSFVNYGQFGIPSFATFNENDDKIIPHKVMELAHLNNAIVRNEKGEKKLQPRKFIGIASGKFHNIAADSMGNVWSWGKNMFGECGFDVNYKTDIQPVPKIAISVSDLQRDIANALLLKNSIKSLTVKKLFAGQDSSYILFDAIDDANNRRTVLSTFGNGLKGQLGSNRFLHVCHKPQIVKSLNNLTEFDEKANRTSYITIKSFSAGANHAFITLDNFGNEKDVLCFGDNEYGQLGNGKSVRSCKTIQIPKLIEPADIDSMHKNKKSFKLLAKKIDDSVTNRLQLLDGSKIDRKSIEQTIVASENSSAIFYKCK
ncbi:Piso0_002859 [Millerozyma farinosa CBS 7064]|uniref:Piso0_002859 protein n=1 Tax=Pichia sorbitophila (strain ATCC MYA-4447 / BCRC 22081 / CBS 7064 / NBRC 10061 / NRRL Y-12695) TaxID=559304 RepID=G8YDQ2_PICSO|nr:Piso0_002859 [Millerozyma farinosa CBS 7064]